MTNRKKFCVYGKDLDDPVNTRYQERKSSPNYRLHHHHISILASGGLFHEIIPSKEKRQ